MTERQMDILYYLHAQDDFVPVSDISVALQVSVKTIRNELLIIQEVIKKESLGTLEKKPRLGIKLVIEAEVWERYTRQLESKGLTAEEADEKSLLIYYLLTKGQINYTKNPKSFSPSLFQGNLSVFQPFFHLRYKSFCCRTTHI